MSISIADGLVLANNAARGNLKDLRKLFVEIVNLLFGLTVGVVTASQVVVVSATKTIGTFLSVTATTFIGNLTGNVTGNVIGNLTGNVTGDVAGTNTLAKTAMSTASTAVNTGVSTIETTKGTTAKTFNLAAPTVGCQKVIAQTGNSTGVNKVKLVSGTFDGKNNFAQFNSITRALALVGVSTSRFVITGNVGPVTQGSTAAAFVKLSTS